jgi:hypothetical protein
MNAFGYEYKSMCHNELTEFNHWICLGFTVSLCHFIEINTLQCNFSKRPTEKITYQLVKGGDNKSVNGSVLAHDLADPKYM